MMPLKALSLADDFLRLELRAALISVSLVICLTRVSLSLHSLRLSLAVCV